MTIQPLRDRVVFRHLERPETALASGVILPADSQLSGSAVLAEVLAVGPGGKPKKSKKEELRLLRQFAVAALALEDVAFASAASDSGVNEDPHELDFDQRLRFAERRHRVAMDRLRRFKETPPSRPPVSVKPGDVILVQKHAGALVDQSTWGDGARSLPEDGILAIVESPEAFHGGRFLKQANQAEKGGMPDATAQ